MAFIRSKPHPIIGKVYYYTRFLMTCVDRNEATKFTGSELFKPQFLLSSWNDLSPLCTQSNLLKTLQFKTMNLLKTSNLFFFLTHDRTDKRNHHLSTLKRRWKSKMLNETETGSPSPVFGSTWLTVFVVELVVISIINGFTIPVSYTHLTLPTKLEV